jgi:ankyrin repeat protein
MCHHIFLVSPPSLAEKKQVFGRTHVLHRHIFLGAFHESLAYRTLLHRNARTMQTPPSATNNAQIPGGVGDDSQATDELHQACMNNDSSTVKSLLSQGVNPNAVDKNGMTALHLACGIGSLEIVQTLLGYHRVTTTECTEGMSNLFRYFCRKSSNSVTTADAAHINLDAKDRFGQTVLHLATYRRHDEIVTEIIKVISEPSSFNAQDHDGWTPLMSATRGRHAAMVRRLLPKSDMSIADNKGQTPLTVAMHRDYLEIVEIFAHHLCSLSSRESDKMTDLVLAWASQSFQRHPIVTIILSYNDSTKSNTTASTSPIERAALLLHPGVLWWLIATSPHDFATKCVKKALKQIKSLPEVQQTTSKTQLLTKSKDMEGNIKIQKLSPNGLHVASAQTKGEAVLGILDILQNPPFETAYQDDPFQNVPEPDDLCKDYEAHIRGFFNNQSASSTICKILSVEDVVYGQGPAKIMKHRFQTEKTYRERGLQISATTDLYDETNSRFTWVHLPATRVCFSYGHRKNEY